MQIKRIMSSARRSKRKCKSVAKFKPTEQIRTRATSDNRKVKRISSRPDRSRHNKTTAPVPKKVRKKVCSIKSFFKPQSTTNFAAPPKAKSLPTSKSNPLPHQTKRRLRSTAPIYELMDVINKTHTGHLKSVGPTHYVCRCDTSFETASYRQRNFEHHLRKDDAYAKTNPW